MRPTTSLEVVYQRFPSGPRARPETLAPVGTATGNSVIAPETEMLAIRAGFSSTNQMLPSGAGTATITLAIRGIRYGVFRDDSLGGDGSHSTGELLSEPEPPVGTDGDRNRRLHPQAATETP